MSAALARACLVAWLVLAPAWPARAGSTEPALAIAAVTAASVDGGVTLTVIANYDHGNVVRLGYPVTVVLTAGSVVARLGLDGSVTVAVGAAPPAAVPGALGVIAIAPDRLTVVVPSALVPGGAASVRLEADYDGTLLQSNAAGVTW